MYNNRIVYRMFNNQTDRIYLRLFCCVQQGDKNLENVTHEEAVATLKATQDRVVLLVAKPEGTLPPPPPASDRSVSPQPRE